MKILAKNKKAFFDYKILETHKAGVVLSGPETKSAKLGHISIKESYAVIKDGEVWLLNCHISPYAFAKNIAQEPARSRKLLLSRKEINTLIGKIKSSNLTLVPLKAFVERGLVKIEIGLCQGKKKYEKRELIKKREGERKMRNFL